MGAFKACSQLQGKLLGLESIQNRAQPKPPGSEVLSRKANLW